MVKYDAPDSTKVPPTALWFSDRGLAAGRYELLRRTSPFDAQTSSRVEALLAVAFGRRLPAHLFRQVVEAAAVSRHGDPVLANLRLALAGLSHVRASTDLSKRLQMADTLLAKGLTPEELLRALDLDDAADGDIAKYDPNQPRVPAGSGVESGRWASVDGASTAARAAGMAIRAARAASLLTAADLGALAAGFVAGAGFAAVLGFLFVPSPNNDVSTGGPLPGDSGASYSYNQDEALLRVLGPDGEVLAAGHKDKDGVFYDAATGVPFAREADGTLIFDDAAAKAGAGAEADDNDPKLCPDPGPDQPGSESASPRAKAYQEQISRMINPQRPLPYGLAMNLVDPATGSVVHFDECEESDGTMIDAKGPGYAGVISFDKGRENTTREWLRQSKNQVSAAGARQIEWYFAEERAADYAQELFAKYDRGRERIVIKVQPAEHQ